ncbi:MAG: response regulator [Nitrospiraceae bacterium]|nr:response regulator [Nitrospirota bacterium]MDA8339775.1 response regulator [Nitrospiraceae bacterium]
MKILVVDDEELICWSLKRTFEKHAGHSVCCVYTGNDAIKKIMENQYDVVITDLKLPDFNGAELVRKIKELGIDTPVIVISSYLSENILEDIMKHGVFRCVNKPFQIEDILNDVEHIRPA